jgi:hypothetical protein
MHLPEGDTDPAPDKVARDRPRPGRKDVRDLERLLLDAFGLLGGPEELGIRCTMPGAAAGAEDGEDNQKEHEWSPGRAARRRTGILHARETATRENGHCPSSRLRNGALEPAML